MEGSKATSENEFSKAPVDFDALAQMAIGSNAPEDWDALFGALFALPEWAFIARGERPNFYPYCAPPATGGASLVRAFTDSERAGRFATENNVLEKDGSILTLHMFPSAVVRHLEGYPVRGYPGVWFNSDSRSTGFQISIKQLHSLAERFLNVEPARKQSVKTLQVIVQEALVLTPDFVRETPYKVNFFCRVPADWLENGELKTEFWKKIADQVFGENWSAETLPIGHYIIKSSETEIFDDDPVKTRNWRDFVETDDNIYYFFIGSENGEAGKVTAQEFQENVDAYFQGAIDVTARSEPSNSDEPENLNELDASLVEAWNEPEKLPPVSEWLPLSRNESVQSQYAYIVLKKHFAREKLGLRKNQLPISWWSMGWALYLNIDVLIREQKRTEMLKAMFAELIDFCEAATGEYFVYHLKELLEKLIDDRSSRDKIKPLLPAKALERFAEIDRMLDEEHEAYIDRLNQMGY